MADLSFTRLGPSVQSDGQNVKAPRHGRRAAPGRPLLSCGNTSQAAQKGPHARRRPTAAREAYSAWRAGGEVSGSGDPGERKRATLSVRPRAPYLRRGALFSTQAAHKGPDAGRRPTVGREAYFLYVERAAEGANEADGPL